MGEAMTGGCACGAIRYHISAAPLAMLYCQCRDCQQETGTGHAALLAFDSAAVVLTGTPSYWDAKGDSGTVKTRGFCPTCGAPVHTTFAANPGVVVLRAASLDDPSQFAPQFVTYHVRAQGWDHLDTALPMFDRMPPG